MTAPQPDTPDFGLPLATLLAQNADALGDRTALVFGKERLGFTELNDRADRRARQLLQLGVVQGSRVVLAMETCLESFDCIFAVWKLGATPCPVSHRLKPSEFDELIALLEPDLILHDGSVAVEGENAFQVQGPPPPASDKTALPDCLPLPGKIICSGGSTGRPKLIVDPMPASWGPDKMVSGLNPGLSVLVASPLYHSGPFTVTTIGLALGCKVVVMPQFDAEQWLDLVRSEQIAYSWVVPTIMTRISKLPRQITDALDFSTLQTLLHTAAPCPPATKRWWIDRLGKRLIEVYGGSERIGATVIDGEEWLNYPGSVGRAMPGQSIHILGEDGLELPPGEIGQIHFRKHDWRKQGYTYVGAESRSQGDLDSFGDMGWLNTEGYLHIADRRTDMLVVGGVNVFPAEIEAVIDAMPSVMSSAVIGLPDPDLGTRVVAIVELAQDAAEPDEDTFLSALSRQLSGFKRPRSVEFTRVRLRDDTGKLRRSQLRADRMPSGRSDWV